MFNTPILLIAWRRPEHLSKVIDAIRKVYPKQVFVAIDGPRLGNEYTKERELIEETKKVVETKIDWECDVKTLYREKNLGCAKGVSSAITWFFEHVEEGIILEDDIIVTTEGLHFFDYCLNKYRNNDNIWMISAWNPFKTNGYSLIQNYFYCWGWATWKRAWAQYSLDMPDLDIRYSRIGKINDYWKSIFIQVQQIDTWDYPMQYWMFRNDAKAIVAPYNYIDNIGFDALGVHTTGNKPDNFDVVHNSSIKRNIIVKIPKLLSDYLDFGNVRHRQLFYGNFYNRAKTKILKLIK